MWICLGWFMHFQISRNRIGGNDNNDTKWSFGQVLAAATWVPVVVEFVYIWWESLVKALNGWLMDPYEIEDVSRKSEASKLIQRRQSI
jgi:hypothetical protein